MAKIKCEYCGGYVQDTEETCPTCGAVNENHQRVTKDPPTTIEELKSWYKARNLPPEETTRFFIGNNIKEPKAFGIYKDNSGNFVVYKNKSNGQRAIRYQGTDEAYAVNELYLRLKEEILNQKSMNQRKRSFGSRSYSSSSKRRKRSTLLSSLFVFIFIAFIIGIVAVPFSIYMIEEAKQSDSGSYYLDIDKNLYYCIDEWSKGYDWWKYNEVDDVWELYTTTHDDYPIEGMTNKENRYDFLGDIREQYAPEMDFDEFYEKYDIYNSREFIDAGHHYEPRQGYYKLGDDAYYYLNDYYGDSYGTRNNSGWYKYENNNWEYYCDYEDKDKLGDDLWYYDDDYRIGSSYDTITTDSYDFENYTWNFTSFENTEWYEEAEAAEDAHDKYVEEHKNDRDNSWDDDDDWDWDSDDDWDYGDTDWDSDW